MRSQTNSVKKSLDSDFFTRLFVSERKQIALMADEKSHTRVSRRLFATSRSEMENSVKNMLDSILFHTAICAAGATK